MSRTSRGIAQLAPFFSVEFDFLKKLINLWESTEIVQCHYVTTMIIMWTFSDPQIGLQFGLRRTGTMGNNLVIEKIFKSNEDVILTNEDYTNLIYIVNVTRMVPLSSPFAEIDLIDLVDSDIWEKIFFNFTSSYHDITEEDEKCK